MLRKKDIAILFLILGILFICGSCRTPATAKLNFVVSFNKIEAEEKLPICGAIYLLEDLMKKMPELIGDDPHPWPWFFRDGIGPIFEKTIVLKNLEEIKTHPEVRVIVKPELWGFFLQSYYGEWTCWLDFKFRFLDRNGKQQFAISVDAKGRDPHMSRALGLAMNEIVERFQKNAIHSKKEEILSLYKKE